MAKNIPKIQTGDVMVCLGDTPKCEKQVEVFESYEIIDDAVKFLTKKREMLEAYTEKLADLQTKHTYVQECTEIRVGEVVLLADTSDFDKLKNTLLKSYKKLIKVYELEVETLLKSVQKAYGILNIKYVKRKDV